MEVIVPKTIRIQVTEYDVLRSESDPSANPLERAISRKLKASLNDVEMHREKVYIWNEWDDPDQIFVLDEEGIDFKTTWEDCHDCPITFEFNLIKRK